MVANMKAGTPFNVTVQALDANNALAENFNGNVTLSAAATRRLELRRRQPIVAATDGNVDIRRARAQRCRQQLRHHRLGDRVFSDSAKAST